MKNILKEWPRISKKLAKRNLFVFCDFDGTLTPIRPRPGLAILGLQQRKFLQSLAGTRGIKLAFVSGRGLQDLKDKISVAGAFYAGNHGLEASGPGFEFLAPLPEGWKETLFAIKRSMLAVEEAFPGILIEDKKLTLSFHYRNVSATRQEACDEAIMAHISPWVKVNAIKVRSGKKVIEVRPLVVWHKGSIVQWLLSNKDPKAAAIFIGDDVTDEDAFKVLKKSGVTVLVGKSADSAAQYCVAGVDAVYRFLKKIKDTRSA